MHSTRIHVYDTYFESGVFGRLSVSALEVDAKDRSLPLNSYHQIPGGLKEAPSSIVTDGDGGVGSVRLFSRPCSLESLKNVAVGEAEFRAARITCLFEQGVSNQTELWYYLC